MRRFLALLILFPLAGCGGGGSTTGSSPAPPLKTLFAKAARATASKHSAHYALDMSVSVETGGAFRNALVQAFAANPIKLHLEGDASGQAFTADGSVSVSGRDFSGKVVAGPKELYAELLGTWYGTKQSGLGTLKQLGRSRLRTVPGAQQSSAQQVRQDAGKLLSGAVSDGPTLDGADTWEFKGTLNANGLAKLSQQNGQALNARQLATLRTLQDGTAVTIDIGKVDHLLRKIDLRLDMRSDDLKGLNQTSGSNLRGINALHISFGLALGKWGEAVTIAPPESYKPFSGLTSSLGFGL